MATLGDRTRAAILNFLKGAESRKGGLPELEEISDTIGVPIDEVSDQIDILESLGALTANRSFGGNAAPMITGAGKYQLEVLTEDMKLNPREIAPAEIEQTNPRSVAFISHASEDKDRFVRDLAHRLNEFTTVWYDEWSLSVGDSLRQKIDEGLGNSDFGILVLSPKFFDKSWTQIELDGLTALGRKLLPVWLDINHSDVAARSPSLAGILAARASDGVEKVAEDLLDAMGVDRPGVDFPEIMDAIGPVITLPNPPVSLGPIKINGDGWDEKTQTGYWSLVIDSVDIQINHLSVLMFDKSCLMQKVTPGPYAIGPSDRNKAIRLSSLYRPEPLPNAMVKQSDERQVDFDVRPGPAAPKGAIPLLLTFELFSGERFGATYYVWITPHSKGYPSLELTAPLPLEWRKSL